MQKKDNPKNLKTLLPVWATAVVLLIFAVGFASSKASDSGDFKITILHTNDIHAHDETFSEHGKQIGGLPRIGHLIRSIRSHEPNAVVIDAGDIFQGTPLFSMYKGEVEVALLSKIGYDLYTVGNHEFDEGPQNLATQLQKAKFKVLNCNMDCSKEPELEKLINPMVIREIEGHKVAFIGAITPDLNQVALKTGGVKIKSAGPDWMRPIEQEVNEAKSKGIKYIILVTHIGIEEDKQLAAALPDVDAIIGGHSHTRLDEAVVVPHPDGTSTVIVQTGCYGRALGKLDLFFDAQGKLLVDQTRYRLINITAKIPADPDLQSYVDEKVKPLLPLREKIVGYSKGEFDNFFRNMPWDSAIGDLITDAIAHTGERYGVQISLENRGGMRGRIERGPITAEKVEEILPFENKIVFATISGACLLRNLEHSVAGPLGGSFLDTHGLKMAYDPTRAKGSRIVFALVQEGDSWQPIKESASYKIAVNDYTFSGGEGYDFKDAAKIEQTPDRIAASLTQYLTDKHDVTPQKPDRIVPISQGLLDLESKECKRVLHVSGVEPGSKLLLVTGSGKGIEPIENVDVPVNDPVIYGTSQADDSGHGEFVVNKDQGPSGKHLWAAVIARPPKGAVSKKPKISYPVPLD